jgi:tetratricopeptide (TPR) repeat protein
MLAVIRRNTDFDWNDYKLVDASFAKADAYYMKGNYKEAYAWYSKNKTKYADGDPCLSGSYNFRIAMSLYKEERFTESARSFITSFEQQQHCDTTLPQLIRMQEILSNTGLSYFNLKMYDSAVYYYNKALNYIDIYTNVYPDKEKQWLGAKAVVYGNIGKLFAAKRQNDSAKIYLMQSLAIDDSFSVNVSDMLTVRIALAKLHLTVEKDDSAKLVLDEIGKYIEKYNMPEVRSNYYNLLWHYYYMKGNNKAALETLVDYTLAKDSSYYKQKKALINDLSEGIHEAEAMYEKELYQQNMKISRITIIALVSVSITTLFIIIWLTRVVFKRKKTIKEQLLVMEEIAWLQSHEMRKPVATMKGLLHVYNQNDIVDPNNAFIIKSVEEQLDDMDKKINEINDKVRTSK